MKKLLVLGAFALSVLAAHSAYSWGGRGYGSGYGYGGGYGYNSGYGYSGNYAGSDCNQCNQCDQATGECYCKYVCYQPCYYNTYRCVEEKIPCQKLCCRYVPRYFDVQKCRYVPQYYSETYCTQECEYYCEPDCRTCYRTICEPQCTYIPRYYWKYNCNPCCN